MYNIIMIITGLIGLLKDCWKHVLIFLIGVCAGYFALVYMINKGIEKAIGG